MHFIETQFVLETEVPQRSAALLRQVTPYLSLSDMALKGFYNRLTRTC